MFLMKAKSLTTQFILSSKQTKTSYWKYKSVLALLPLCLVLGCSDAMTPTGDQPTSSANEADTVKIQDEPSAASSKEEVKGSRDCTPKVLTPEANGENVLGNEVASIDISNTSKGYVVITYLGSSPKVKLQITGPNQVTYTYNLTPTNAEVFPLSAGSGTYAIGVYENIEGTQYATSFYEETAVTIEDEFLPFLYPNQYVNFNTDSETVALASKLAYSANSDLEVIDSVYNYIIENISYDEAKAADIASGYLCDVDSTLETGSGICLDYASLMTAMLRSQGIPTQLEVGYAKDVYHAWISTYVAEKGWINGIIEFDGNSWSLMDPTFAANSSEKSLKKFIGEGDNYTVKYIY